MLLFIYLFISDLCHGDPAPCANEECLLCNSANGLCNLLVPPLTSCQDNGVCDSGSCGKVHNPRSVGYCSSFCFFLTKLLFLLLVAQFSCCCYWCFFFLDLIVCLLVLFPSYCFCWLYSCCLSFGIVVLCFASVPVLVFLQQWFLDILFLLFLWLIRELFIFCCVFTTCVFVISRSMCKPSVRWRVSRLFVGWRRAYS